MEPTRKDNYHILDHTLSSAVCAFGFFLTAAGVWCCADIAIRLATVLHAWLR